MTAALPGFFTTVLSKYYLHKPDHTVLRIPQNDFMQQDRQAIRRRNRERRRTLEPDDQRHRASALTAILTTNNLFLHSHRLAFYWPSDGELDPREVLAIAQAAGKRCYLPVLHPLQMGHLHFVDYGPETVLTCNRYGIAEPDLRGVAPTPPWALDIIFLPLVAFDRQGNRLGMGAGFYDRTLANIGRSSSKKPALIGVAHAFQEVAQLTPCPWDVPLHGIATEKEFILI